jgi:hypothetical protein
MRIQSDHLAYTQMYKRVLMFARVKHASLFRQSIHPGPRLLVKNHLAYIYLIDTAWKTYRPLNCCASHSQLNNTSDKCLLMKLHG